MLAQVKQEIQRYYPHDYLFLEFLKHGGWQTTHVNQVTVRHQVVLDSITFELAQYHEHADLPTPGIVIRTFYQNPSRISGIPILGPNARVNKPSEIHDVIFKIMTGIYHSPRFRGTSYHAVI